MAYSYVILEEAQLEYESIVLYLRDISDGPSAALRFMDEFEHQIALVCENPNLFGLSRFEWLAKRGYHLMPINNYRALYRVVDNQISIDHIFHLRQDYARLGF